MLISVSSFVVGRMREKNSTVKAWAVAHGYKPDTVYKAIYGMRGKQRRGLTLDIKRDLQREVFWPADTENAESHHVSDDSQPTRN